MAIDPVGKKIGEGELKLPLDNPAVADALRRGNIKDVHKLLADYGITAADFEQFAASQYGKYMSGVVQPEPLFEGYGAIQPPDIDSFPEHDPSNALTDEDLKEMSLGLGKAMTAGKAQSAAPDTEGVQRHVDEWQQFYSDVLEPQIVEAQFQQQLQAKSAELQREMDKILELIKKGVITDVMAIVALAKVEVGKGTLLFTHTGKKVMDLNQRANAVTEQLMGSSQFEKDSVLASTKLKNIGQSTQFLINDMNQVSQFIQSTLTFAKSSIDAINNLRSEMIRKLSPT